MECNIYQTVKNIGLSKQRINKVVCNVLARLKKNGDVSINMIGDQKMADMNRKYRGKQGVTDVLSFSTLNASDFFSDKGDLGDIFININQIKRQAKRIDISYNEEFFRMLIHGILHLLGYDHQKKKEAEKMFKLQENLLMNALK